VITNGIPSYYAVDSASISRIVKFDQSLNYQSNSVLPYSNTYTLKYVNGYFYFTADNYFYRTDTNFQLNATYSAGSFVGYRQFFFDSNSQLFYVAPFKTQSIELFDVNCVYKRSISLQNNYPYGLNIFNDNIYVGTTGNQILVVSKSTEQITNQVNCNCSSSNNYLVQVV